MERKAVPEAKLAGLTGRRKRRHHEKEKTALWEGKDGIVRRKRRHYEKEKTAVVDTYGAAPVGVEGGTLTSKRHVG